MSTKSIINLVPKLVLESLKRGKKANITMMAASLSYTTVFSIVPTLAVGFYFFKKFGGLEWSYAKILPFLLNFLSEGSGEAVAKNLSGFIQRVQAKTVGIYGMLALLLTAALTFETITKAINMVLETEKEKKVLDKFLRFLIVFTLGPILISLSIGLTAWLTAYLRKLPLSAFLLAVLLNYILYLLIYSFIPLRKIMFRHIAKSAIIPAILLECAKSGYAFYTAKVVSYSRFYGYFAALPLFLLWIYIAWCITLYGAVWIRMLELRRIQILEETI